MDYLKREKKATRSKAMQWTHLNKDKMSLAQGTLLEMDLIEVKIEQVDRLGTGTTDKTVLIWKGKEAG